MRKSENNGYLFGKRATSVIIIWLLVASAIVIVMPLKEPNASAILYHEGTAAWEDGDFGGGLDYNGDPAGDNKITWHAVNNTHIVNNHFAVSDGYILEIEEGCIVTTDPGIIIQVGTTNGATLYINGTQFNPVLMGPNSTGAWGGIYVRYGSYAFIQSAWIDQADFVYVEDSTLDVNATAITNSATNGIYSTGSLVSVTFSAILGTDSSPGIYAQSSDLTASYLVISDAQSAAIRCDSSNAVIEYSDLFGYNASAGGGGDAIFLSGISSYVTISNNFNIIGGRGVDDLGAGGGDGGDAIDCNTYDGQLSIVGNQRIEGGRGGNNTSPGMNAGSGGYGANVIPISDSAPPPAVNISGNTLILGGRGGNNNAISDGDAGNGEDAIRIIDIPTGSMGNAIISSNNDIIGGEGGHNYASVGTSGWMAGEGGNGIYVIHVRKPGSVQITNNPNIVGGNGGNNSGVGNFITSAGEGGHGVMLLNSTDVTITNSTIMGGHGGNNTISGFQANAGDGGNGVYLTIPPGGLSSAATISSSLITGGEGGDDYVGMGGPMMGGAGAGGIGIESYQSSGIVTSSNVLGGRGGGNFGPMSFGGQGGYATVFSSSNGWSVDGGNLIGGKGGSNYHASGGGGAGQSAVYISGTDNIGLSLVSLIIGGDGGDADLGDMGPGSAATSTIYATGSSGLNIVRNTVRTGIGGFNASSGEYGENGSYCIYSDTLGLLNTITGNNITANSRSSNKYGIRISLGLGGSAVISGNEIYNNNVGIFAQSSMDLTIGNTNDIYDNFIGIYLMSSDSTLGTGNRIYDNDYGIYAYDSSPTITGDEIINSTTVGLRLTERSNATVEGTTIKNKAGWSVFCDGPTLGGSNPKLINSTLSVEPAVNEIYSNEDSHPWLLNTTFDQSKAMFGDTLSNLTVNWFMHVKVIDTTFVGVPSATVWINDTNDNNLYQLSTDAQGWAPWNVVREYVENSSGFEYYDTPHNVSAWESGRFGNAKPDMTLSRVVLVMLDGISLDISLSEGWNMISIPVNQSTTSLVDVLASIAGRYSAVQWFDASDSSNLWKHHHITKPPAMNDLTDIDKLMGIWILMDMDYVLPIAGPIPAPPTTDIELKTGWNLVGYPSITTRVAGNESGEAFESIAGFVDMVQYYDANDGADPWKAWDYGSYSPDDLSDIQQGMGLWIHVNADCTWSVGW
jgi:parallel beta-helix repeat protein